MDSDFPFVSFGRSHDDWDYQWIDTDGHEGVKLAVEYLIELGHRRIAMFAWPRNSLSGNYRLSGYLEAIQQADLPVADDFVIHSAYKDDIIERTFAHWRGLPASERPTAVIAVSDFVAVPVMRAAEHFGFRVGKTLSIIGFDDAPVSVYLQPALTTLRQPIVDITHTLFDVLEDGLQGVRSQAIGKLFMPELIIRGSTGAPQDE
jgi:LacI family transcriptional regulator